MSIPTIRIGKNLANLYKIIDKDKDYQSTTKHVTYPNFKNCNIQIPFQMTAIGTTGAGKTNSLLAIVIEMACFSEFYICTKLTNEKLYDWFIKKMQKIEAKIGEKIVYIYNDPSEMPSVKDFVNDGTQRLFIYDDMVLENKKKQAIIGEAWAYGRKVGVSCAYLTQSWFLCPRFIRLNSSYIVLKKIGSVRDINCIIKDSGLDINTDQLMKMYKEATQDMESFFLIDKITKDPSLMYRQNL